MSEIQQEYEETFARHKKLMEGAGPEALIEIASDLAARLEMVALVLPGELVSGLAEVYGEGEQNEAATNNAGDSESSGDSEDEEQPAEAAERGPAESSE